MDYLPKICMYVLQCQPTNLIVAFDLMLIQEYALNHPCAAPIITASSSPYAQTIIDDVSLV